MESRFAGLTVLLGLVAGAGFAGCGGSTDDLPRQPVSGTVTFNGEPLAEGRIFFEPSSPEAKVTAGGDIKDGAFTIPRDQGPTPGDYRIMISSAGVRKVVGDMAPGAEPSKKGVVKMPPPSPELIPKQYNSKTTLSAKVEANKSNVLEFPLKK